jgi:hypothetical protein
MVDVQFRFRCFMQRPKVSGLKLSFNCCCRVVMVKEAPTLGLDGHVDSLLNTIDGKNALHHASCSAMQPRSELDGDLEPSLRYTM